MEDLGSHLVEGEEVSLAAFAFDHAEELGGPVVGWTFRRCQIVGPAVVLFMNVTVDELRLNTPSIDGMFWSIPADMIPAGCVVLQDCHIEDCTLLWIGQASNDVEALRRQMQL